MKIVANQKTELKSFTDLNAWQEAHKLSVKVYKIADSLPKSDSYGLAQQMQRAVLSTTSNIAEGFGRQTKADTMHFYIMARASLTELQNQLFLARDTGKISPEAFDGTYNQTIVAIKLVGGLIRSTNRITNS